MKNARSRIHGFSLIELVIVVVIIAIIGAIAIPKMSRGAAGANDSALIQDLAVLRSAADLYNSEHPNAPLSGVSSANLPLVLNEYSDASGTPSATKTTTAIYGPYLHAVPSMPVGTNKGQNSITLTGPAGTTAGAGWFFDGSTFWANDPSTDKDQAGNSYNTSPPY